MDISDLSFSRQQLASDPNLIERQIAACDGNDSRIQAVRRLIMVGVRAIQPALHASLVDTVLKLPWRESQGLCESVLDFCLELVSAVPAFNKPVIMALVAAWLPAAGQNNKMPEPSEDATLPRVHQCLRGILRVTPLAVSNLFHAVKEHLPHRRRDLYLHVGFYHELLSMLDYCYPLRARVLHLLVERLVDLDVQIARQEQALEEAAENDETIFEVESETSAEELKKMRQNAEKLDTLLAMLMEAVRATCSATADDAVTTTTAASTSTAAHAETSPAQASDVSDGVPADDVTATLPPPTLGGSGAQQQQHSSPYRKGAASLLGNGGASTSSANSVIPNELPMLPPPAGGGSLLTPSNSRSASTDGLPMLSAPPAPNTIKATTAAATSAATPASSVAAALAAADIGEVQTATTPQKVARTLSGNSIGQPSPGSCSLLEAPADPSESLFEALVAAFRESVLPTYKCRAVQFLLFYVCSFEEHYSRSFLQLLLAQMRSEHVHSEARIGCASYIASFLARAKFADPQMVLTATRELITWAAEYQNATLSRLESGGKPALDVHIHGVFYAAMQGVLYILCYRHEQLRLAEGGRALTSLSDTLTEVLHGPLNPLKFTLDAIVLEFERLNVCDVADLVTDNEKLVVSSKSANGHANALEDFFPFDPLHGFKRSASVIAPLYQEWVHRPHGSSEPRDSNVSSHEDASRSLANSLQGMSVTPSEHGDGPMGEHMRRRLAENRSHVSSLVGGGSSPFASPALQPNRAPPNIPTFGGL